MIKVSRIFSSSIGKKWLMAITGIGFLGFLFSHLIGNLLLFISPNAYNKYAHTLTSNPLIYVAEAILLILFFGHIILALILTFKANRARSSKYHVVQSKKGPSRRTIASGTMFYSGLVIFVFVVVHVVTVKYGKYYYALVDGEKIRDLYKTVALMFTNPFISLGYIISVLFVGFHLFHAFSSSVQTVGVETKKKSNFVVCLGRLIAVFITIGFLSMPIWFYIIGNR